MWQPLLSGSLQATAEQACIEIGEALIELQARRLESGQRAHPALGGGAAGLALFFAYLATSSGRSDFMAAADQHLEEAIAGLSDEILEPGLFNGLAGIGWTVEHLGTSLDFFDEDADPCGEIDLALLDFLTAGSPPARQPDLISGLAGIGVYAAERGDRGDGRSCLTRMLDLFVDTAEQPLYDLGVAHGLAGTIPVLANLVTLGVEAERAQALVSLKVERLLAQENGDACRPFLFPDFAGPGILSHRSRLAWCYGDAGIAATLLNAGRQCGEAAWERAAARIARHAAAIAAEQSGVRDASLCHGAFGVGHLLNRLAQELGDDLLAEQAVGWFERGLALRSPQYGIAGFYAWERHSDIQPLFPAAIPGFLLGAAGMGLALLAASNPLEPQWDRTLLLSPPGSNSRADEQNC